MSLEHTNLIDVIAHDAPTDEVALIMRETRPWDGSPRQLFELQEKTNAYLAFALDGEMHEAFPQFAGKKIRLQLESASAPDANALALIEAIRAQIAFQGIEFVVRLAGCGEPGCGCHS